MQFSDLEDVIQVDSFAVNMGIKSSKIKAYMVIDKEFSDEIDICK